MSASAVIFDLDGTLVDSLPDLADAVNHMLTSLGLEALNQSDVRQLIGKGARNLVQRALSSNSPPDIDRGLALFTEFNTRHIADKSQLYPGILGILQQLRAQEVRMAVVSNKNEALCQMILKALHIDHFFEIIAGGDTFTEMKPSPLPLQKVITLFNCLSTQAIMVGDSINDIQAGNQAGATTIGCTWGYGERKELDEAAYCVKSVEELSGILIRLTTVKNEKESPMSQKPSELYLKIKERHGDLIDAVEELSKTARAAGPLDEKTGHLIQLGAAAAIHSIGSVRSHAARALASGATLDEIHHAIIILTSTIGFPTVAAALSWVDDALEKKA